MEGDIHVDCAFGHRGVALGEMRRPFHRGKVYVIAGPNGAGKSTLLQTIAGELEPVTGTVRIGDTDPASRAGVGSVARVADPVFLPDLTVGEHLKLLASHGRFDYEDVVQHWGLEALVTSMPAWISSGQRAMKWSHSHEHYHCKNPGCAVPIGCSSVGDWHRTRCGKLAYHAFIDAFPGLTHTRRGQRPRACDGLGRVASGRDVAAAGVGDQLQPSRPVRGPLESPTARPTSSRQNEVDYHRVVDNIRCG